MRWGRSKQSFKCLSHKSALRANLFNLRCDRWIPIWVRKVLLTRLCSQKEGHPCHLLPLPPQFIFYIECPMQLRHALHWISGYLFGPCSSQGHSLMIRSLFCLSLYCCNHWPKAAEQSIWMSSFTYPRACPPLHLWLMTFTAFQFEACKHGIVYLQAYIEYSHYMNFVSEHELICSDSDTGNREIKWNYLFLKSTRFPLLGLTSKS